MVTDDIERYRVISGGIEWYRAVAVNQLKTKKASVPLNKGRLALFDHMGRQPTPEKEPAAVLCLRNFDKAASEALICK